MRILHQVRWVIERALIASFALMVFMAILQASARYIFRYPLGWTEEAARFLLIWSTFLAVPVLAARRKLMRVDALFPILSARTRAAVELVTSLASAVFLLWVAWIGTGILELAARQLSPALRIPYVYFYVGLPIGFTAGAVYLVVAAVEQWRSVRHAATAPGREGSGGPAPALPAAGQAAPRSELPDGLKG